nr:unnamed protein product [Spirometra erinaceieuropaei]
MDCLQIVEYLQSRGRWLKPPGDKRQWPKKIAGPGTLGFTIPHLVHIHFAEELSSRLRAHNFEKTDGPGYNVRVKHAIIHPDFPVDGVTKGLDIALLKLNRAVNRSHHASFACLPEDGEKFNAANPCYVAGWGLIPNLHGKPSQKQPEVLMEKPATITDISLCDRVFKSINKKVLICTKQGPVTSCVGDSGGGLHCQAKDGRWTVYGVASFALPDCRGEYYVAASTGHAIKWIKDTIASAN